jgi:NAD(P)-dependent dehydrogenase (short-subunit alcohol dehydrogenase family)
MPDLGNRLVSYGAAAKSLRDGYRPRVLITGACGVIGRGCAEALFSHGAELILCDKDVGGVRALADELEVAGLYCDVASEAGVLALVAEVLGQNASLDMVINAAGGGYERTLGMYRVSRALLPALRQDGHTLLVNIPPSSDDGDKAIFPYASSAFAFHRLSAALAFETRGTPVRVLIGCPASGRVSQVLPDANGGCWADSCEIRQPNPDGVGTLVRKVVALIEDEGSISRRAS